MLSFTLMLLKSQKTQNSYSMKTNWIMLDSTKKFLEHYLFFDRKEALTSFKLKFFIKFSSFFMWMMLPEIFCQFYQSCTFENTAWKLPLRRNFNAFSQDTSLAFEIRVNGLLTIRRLG